MLKGVGVMIIRFDPDDPEIRDQINRITIRLNRQGQSETQHVLERIFPNGNQASLGSIAQDLSAGNEGAVHEIISLMRSTGVHKESFDTLSGKKQDAQILSLRSSYEPTKFELTITCARTPMKEFFEECREITCENCIESRLKAIKFSSEKQPWKIELERLEQRRVDLCKKCGNLLSKKDNMIMREERLIYKCHSCGHRGWNQAK